jgi:hypothetical protein
MAAKRDLSLAQHGGRGVAQPNEMWHGAVWLSWPCEAMRLFAERGAALLLNAIQSRHSAAPPSIAVRANSRPSTAWPNRAGYARPRCPVRGGACQGTSRPSWPCTAKPLLALQSLVEPCGAQHSRHSPAQRGVSSPCAAWKVSAIPSRLSQAAHDIAQLRQQGHARPSRAGMARLSISVQCEEELGGHGGAKPER